MGDRDEGDTEGAGPRGADVGDVVIQLLRMLSEVDLEALGDDLRRLDRTTSQQAMTGASLLAEAITRAVLGTDAVGDVLGVDLDGGAGHVPRAQRGELIEVHDDETVTGTGTGSGAGA